MESRPGIRRRQPAAADVSHIQQINAQLGAALPVSAEQLRSARSWTKRRRRSSASRRIFG
jgi:hypothetical protein